MFNNSFEDLVHKNRAKITVFKTDFTKTHLVNDPYLYICIKIGLTI